MNKFPPEWDALLNHKLFPIYSTKTTQIHINANRQTLFFEDDVLAKEYVTKHKNVRVGVGLQSKPENIQAFISRLYGMGTAEILVTLKDEKEPLHIKIEPANVMPSLYNPMVMFNILRLKHTAEKKYLEDLKGSMFISAVVLTKRKPQGYPKIQYVFGKMPNSNKQTRYFFLFTTMKEFSGWNKAHEYKYEPCEVEIRRFEAIRKKNPVLINPNTDAIVLTEKQLKENLH